jgi:hypothetical protein
MGMDYADEGEIYKIGHIYVWPFFWYSNLKIITEIKL